MSKLTFSNGINIPLDYTYENYYSYQDDSKLTKFAYSIEYFMNVNVMFAIVLLSTVILMFLNMHLFRQPKHKLEPEEMSKPKKGETREVNEIT